MDIEVVEKKKDKLKIAVKGETHSLLNLIRENAWRVGAKSASYVIEHPYLSDPKIIIKSEKPKRILSNSAQLVINQATDFGKEFGAQSKKR